MARSTPHFRDLPRIVLIAAALGAVGCASDPVDTPDPGPTPIPITEQFTDTVTVNGARTTPFTATRAGNVSAKIIALSPDETVTVGLSLGTWNGSACQLIITNDSAVLNTTVVGTAQAIGQFCARVYDVGKLTAATDYTIEITHY